MGLIVVVVLLSLGMFFVVSFQIQKQPEQIKQDYDDDQLASNFILAFLKTSAGCQEYTIQEMIQDCATERNLYCFALNSCAYVNQSANYLITETFDDWNKKYNFTIEGLPVNINFQKNCSRFQDKDSSIQPISLYPVTSRSSTVKLDVCR